MRFTSHVSNAGARVSSPEAVCVAGGHHGGGVGGAFSRGAVRCGQSPWNLRDGAKVGMPKARDSEVAVQAEMEVIMEAGAERRRRRQLF